MPTYVVYVYSPSDFVGGLPDEQSAAAAGSGPFTLTLSPTAEPTLIYINDDDAIFDEVDTQTLASDVTIDGTPYTAGTSVQTAYDLIDTGSGHQVTSIHFGGDGYQQGAVDGLVSTEPLVPGQSYTFDTERTSHNQNNEYDQFVACFTTGTRLRSGAGETAIEDLAPGDLVWTLDDGLQPVRWIGSRTVRALGVFAPVRLARGVLGLRRDLLVSQQHRVLVSGAAAELYLGIPEGLCAAVHLPGDGAARVVPGGYVTYWHLMFDRHQIVEAEGMLTESLLVSQQALEGLRRDSIDELTALFPELTAPDITTPARPLLRRYETRAVYA